MPIGAADRLRRSSIILSPFLRIRCKAAADKLPTGKTAFLLVTGSGTAFENGSATPSVRDFSDGTSNTIILVEADADEAVEWTKPDDWRFDPNDPTRGLGSLRPAGFLAGFADTHIDFITNDADPEVIKSLMTPAGREQMLR